MKTNLIGIVGLMGSGKGTVGEYLVIKHGFKTESYASSLKDAVSSIFGWPRHLLEGDTIESRKWREEPDEYWSKKLSNPTTPRWVLQHIGTDILRDKFADNIWIWSLERKLANISQSTVITDVRFPNEVKMMANLGAKLIWVRRAPEPGWVINAITDKNKVRILSGIHSSEYEWIGEYDYEIIWNNGSLDDLYKQVDNIL